MKNTINPLRLLNQLFNGPATDADGTESAYHPNDDVGVKQVEGSLGSLTRALRKALENFAKQEVADLHRLDGTCYALRSLQIGVKTNNQQYLTALSRLPSKKLKTLLLSALKQSSVERMYNTAELFGASIVPTAEADTQDWLQVLDVYEQDHVAYQFEFEGDLCDADLPSSASTTAQASKTNAHASAQATPMLDSSPTPFAHAQATPLLADMQLVLHSDALWPDGWGHPFANAKELSVYDLPLCLGRASVAPDRQSGQGFGVQVGSDGLPFAALYGDEHLSLRHLSISQGAGGWLCVTDHSSNGTWLDGQRLPKGVPTPLPATGELSLCSAQGATKSRAKATSVRFALAQDVACTMPTASTAKPVAHTPAPAVAAPAPAAAPLATAPSAVTRSADLPIQMLPARETDLSDGKPSAVQAMPQGSAPVLAILRVRSHDGSETTHPIAHWPLDIGREGFITLPDSCIKVSRQHLRLERPHGRSGFQVSNTAHPRNGTFRKTRREDAHFVWEFAQSGRADEGWLVLGAPTMGAGTVQMRLEKPTGAQQ